MTVADKVNTAQNFCQPNLTCLLVIPPEASAWAPGSLLPVSPPIYILDYRLGPLSGTVQSGLLNNVRWVCNLSSFFPFQTVASAVSDIMANTTNGGVVYTCPGHHETFTSQIDLGSTTKTVVVVGNADTILDCNVTSGPPAVCFNVHNGSGLVGFNAGAQGSSRTGGFVIRIDATANIAAGFQTPEGLSGGSGQAFVILVNTTWPATVGATISTAVVNFEGISTDENINNNTVFASGSGTLSTALIRIASNATNVVGPILLENNFADCTHNAGCTPLLITAPVGGKPVLPVDIMGGYYNHPGSGLPAIDIEGNGANNLVRGIRINTYVENLANGASKIVKIVDAGNITINALRGAICGIGGACSGNDTLIDISESAANLTSNVHIEHAYVSCTGGTCTTLNDHVSGVTDNHVNLTHYNLGGDPGASFSPYYIADNEIDSVNGSLGQKFHQWLTNGSAVHRNFADAENDVIVDSGNTASQLSCFVFRDRGTNEYKLCKNASNVMFLQDIVTGKTIFSTIPTTDQMAFANGIFNDGSGYKHKRVAGCATGAVQFNTCDVTVTWTTAFADANYTVACVGDVVTSGVPAIQGIDISAAKAAASITVRTIALTAAAAQFTTIDCKATHD